MTRDEFKTEIRQEIGKIQSLEGNRRYRYIWDYYKLPIGILAFLVFFIVYMAMMLHNSVSEHWLYVAFVNTTKNLDNGSELWKEYADYTGYDTSQALIDFNSDFYFDYLKNSAQGNKYYELFVTYIDAGTLDCAVMETEALLSFGASGRFMDLNNEACSGLMEKYADRILYVTPNDETYSKDPVPIGIDITDSKLKSEYDIYTDGTEYALAVGVFSQNQEAIGYFLDMILETPE